MQTLGQIQALAEAPENEQSASQTFKQIQTQVASWDLTQQTMLKGPIFSGFLPKLTEIQKQVTSMDLDKQSISGILKSLRQVNTQVETMLPKQLAALNLNEQMILGFLQKFGQTNDPVESTDSVGKEFSDILQKLTKT
jgi:DNA polymerase III psi subunit